MGRIVYTITSGELPITVNLKDDVGTIIDTNIHASFGTYSFENVDRGTEDYITFTIEFIDSMDCYESETVTLCVNCPDGYDAIGDKCIYYEEESPIYTSPTYTVLRQSPNSAYGGSGPLLFSSWNYNGTGVYERFGSGEDYWDNLGSLTGPMNRSCVWSSTTYSNQDIAFSFCINIATPKTYYVGFGCDNWGKIKLNGSFILEQDISALTTMFTDNGDEISYDPNRITFMYWYLYPIEIPAGQNVLEVFGHNVSSVAAVGIQIYDATPTDFKNATTSNPLGDKILFSSETLDGDTLQYEYSTANGYHGYYCEPGYALDTCGATAKCVKRIELNCGEEPPTTTTSTTVVSTTTTTTVAPTTTTTTTEEVTTTTTTTCNYIEKHVVGTSTAFTTSSYSSSTKYWFAQTFTCNVTDVNQIRINHDKVGTPDFKVRAYIYEGSVSGETQGSITNTLVATSTNTLDVTILPTGTLPEYGYNFNTLSLNGIYSLVLEYEDEVIHDSNDFRIYVSADDTEYTDGTFLKASSGGTYSSEGRDIKMRLVNSSCVDYITTTTTTTIV